MTTLSQHIDTASEAIRAANHATMRAALDVPDTYPVVGGLAELVGRLPQVLDYLARSLRRADPAENYDDRGCDPGDTVDQARGRLDDARACVVSAQEHLGAVHNHLSHLGRRIDPED